MCRYMPPDQMMVFRYRIDSLAFNDWTRERRAQGEVHACVPGAG
jgi:hypothetical protein